MTIVTYQDMTSLWQGTGPGGRSHPPIAHRIPKENDMKHLRLTLAATTAALIATLTMGLAMPGDAAHAAISARPFGCC